MEEPTTLGAYLRRERERRGLALRTISESTKVSVPLLEGLEADDISRWPGGIFRRAFVRSYAECVGLDPDDVFRRFEKQHQPEGAASDPVVAAAAALASQSPKAPTAAQPFGATVIPPAQRTRVLGTAGDLTVAMILAFASAAAGSRLLWPVLLIAGYYAIGVLLTGTSPMVALLGEQATAPADPPAREPVPAAPANRPSPERRHQPRRTNERPRQRRGAQQVRAQ
jgi:hypothetical protein